MVDHLVYIQTKVVKSADTVLVAIDIDLQMQQSSHFSFRTTSSLEIFPKGTFTVTSPCFKRVLAIARMWAVLSLFLSSFRLRLLAIGFRSLIRWTSLMVVLSSHTKIMVSADDKVSSETQKIHLIKTMITQVNPSWHHVVTTTSYRVVISYKSKMAFQPATGVCVYNTLSIYTQLKN